MCSGIDCFRHEDQSMCEDNGGRWTAVHSCEVAIASQGLVVMSFAEDGMGTDVAGIAWLAVYGDVCCIGYEPPGQGSCDLEIDIYVSVVCHVRLAF
jgi:hypothetical protein